MIRIMQIGEASMIWINKMITGTNLLLFYSFFFLRINVMYLADSRQQKQSILDTEII